MSVKESGLIIVLILSLVFFFGISQTSQPHTVQGSQKVVIPLPNIPCTFFVYITPNPTTYNTENCSNGTTKFSDTNASILLQETLNAIPSGTFQSNLGGAGGTVVLNTGDYVLHATLSLGSNNTILEGMPGTEFQTQLDYSSQPAGFASALRFAQWGWQLNDLTIRENTGVNNNRCLRIDGNQPAPFARGNEQWSITNVHLLNCANGLLIVNGATGGTANDYGTLYNVLIEGLGTGTGTGISLDPGTGTLAHINFYNTQVSGDFNLGADWGNGNTGTVANANTYGLSIENEATADFKCSDPNVINNQLHNHYDTGVGQTSELITTCGANTFYEEPSAYSNTITDTTGKQTRVGVFPSPTSTAIVFPSTTVTVPTDVTSTVAAYATTTMSLSVEPNLNYCFESVIYVTNSGGSSQNYEIHAVAVGASLTYVMTDESNTRVVTAVTSPILGAAGTSANVGDVMWGRITVGTTVTTIQIDFANPAAAGTTTVKAGSYITVSTCP